MISVDRVEFLTQVATPLAASLGLELWGVELVGSSRPVARLYVDKHPQIQSVPLPTEVSEGVASEPTLTGATEDNTSAGVTIDQCADLSRLVGLTLDVEDPFATNWVLEVSSPGLERPFFAVDQLRAYTGREVDVVLNQPHPEWPGRKKFCGVLSTVADETFTLVLPVTARKDDEPETVIIPWPDVRKAHLVHTFPQTTRPGHKKAGAAKDASGGIA